MSGLWRTLVPPVLWVVLLLLVATGVREEPLWPGAAAADERAPTCVSAASPGLPHC